MEILSIIISVLITITLIYGVGRIMFTHKQLIKIYREEDMLTILHLFLIIALSTLLIIVMTALNEEYWHLPYIMK